jgi:hypothetical protein
LHARRRCKTLAASHNACGVCVLVAAFGPRPTSDCPCPRRDPYEFARFEALIRQRNVFMWAAAGYGKTRWLTRHMLPLMDRMYGKKCVWRCATTTGASLNIGGNTIHGLAGIKTGAGTVESLVNKIKARKTVLARWRTVKAIAIEEISLMSAELFSKLEQVARIVRGSDEFFGGVRLLFVGDLKQLRPCNDKTEDSLGRVHVHHHKYFFECDAYTRADFAVATLTTCWRQRNDPDMARLLELLRNTVTEDMPEERWPDELWDLVNRTKQHAGDREGSVRLTCTKDAAAHHNNFMMEKLTGEKRTYCALDKRAGQPPRFCRAGDLPDDASGDDGDDNGYKGTRQTVSNDEHAGAHVLSSVVAAPVLDIVVGTHVLAARAIGNDVPNGSYGICTDLRKASDMREEDLGDDTDLLARYGCTKAEIKDHFDGIAGSDRPWPICEFEVQTVNATGAPRLRKVVITCVPTKFEVLDANTADVIASRVQVRMHGRA